MQPLFVTTLTALGVALLDITTGTVPGRGASRSLVQMHSLLGGALSLLLVFRTNSAYNRFWEARRIWENLLNRSRELARYCYCFKSSLRPERVTRISQLLTTFPAMLRTHLCGAADASGSRQRARRGDLDNARPAQTVPPPRPLPIAMFRKPGPLFTRREPRTVDWGRG